MPSCRRAIALLVVGLVVSLAGTPEAAPRTAVRARHGMVATAEQHASEAGVAVLKQGGNAVDAAVAVGFALAVTLPEAGNLGGGGFMVIRLADGRETTIDYREAAPGRATRDMFLDEAGQPVASRSLTGPLACGVPGSVAGLALAQRTYGRLTLAEVMAPAIALARDGFEVSWSLADSLASAQPRLANFSSSVRAFYKPDGSAPQAGDRLVQADLARTLQLIASNGPDAFYKGPIADLIVHEMASSGGLISKEDLAAYRARERAPITGTFRGYHIASMGPPSSGGIALIELLNILEGYPLADYGPNASRTMHLMIEAERRVYADRAEWLGDPDFVKVPVSGLIAKPYADKLRASISTERATPSREISAGQPATFEPPETTHYSVVDADGNAVATTTTLNGGYGNAQVVTGAGFLLNNEMDDFSVKPGAPNMFGVTGGAANAVAPGKRMLSSMTPTIVSRDGKTVLVIGTPGGSTIITTVLQVVLNMLEFGMGVQEAVDAPRFHHQWTPDSVALEDREFPADVATALGAMGHRLRMLAGLGDVQAIAIDQATGVRSGASDPRHDGVALGY